MHPRARRATSVALSIALHALLLLWVATVTATIPQLAEPAPLPVRIIEPRARPKAPKPPEQVAKAAPSEPARPDAPPPEAQQPPSPERKLPLPEQIVQPPDAGRNEVPPDTRFKSDRDTRVEREQVKRGEPKPGESAPEPAAAAEPAPKKPPAPPRPRPARDGAPPGRQSRPQVAALPSLDRLLPNAVRLAQEGYGQPPEVVPDVAEQRPRRALSGGNEGLFIPTGPVGTLDYLPDIREGDITLLNTKAEVFAPFVRRVALRVFQNFLISLKKDLSGAPLTTHEEIEAEAVMDPRGEMIDFNVMRRSSRISLGSDRRLHQACNVGFFDRNPPSGARWQDGNIHFLFATVIESVGTPQGVAFMVQLAAGLK
jgi:hypothetical protein